MARVINRFVLGIVILENFVCRVCRVCRVYRVYDGDEGCICE